MASIRLIVGMAMSAWGMQALGAELPELDIDAHCKREASANNPKLEPRDDVELLFSLCVQWEHESKKDARWHLRMVPDDDLREKCIAEGLKKGSHRALDNCLGVPVWR